MFLDKATGALTASAYSDPALGSTSANPPNAGADRMVTFAVTGFLTIPGDANSFSTFSDGTHYVLGFEDGVDFDFNDLVVEVSGVAPGVAPVPDGGSAMTLMSTAILALGALRRKLI